MPTPNPVPSQMGQILRRKKSRVTTDPITRPPIPLTRASDRQRFRFSRNRSSGAVDMASPSSSLSPLVSQILQTPLGRSTTSSAFLSSASCFWNLYKFYLSSVDVTATETVWDENKTTSEVLLRMGLWGLGLGEMIPNLPIELMGKRSRKI